MFIHIRFCFKVSFDPYPGPKGLLHKGPIWSPHRLFTILTGGAFILLVPVLYGAIYRARRAHALTALGRLHHSAHLYCAGQGSARGSEPGGRKAIIFRPQYTSPPG